MIVILLSSLLVAVHGQVAVGWDALHGFSADSSSLPSPAIQPPRPPPPPPLGPVLPVSMAILHFPPSTASLPPALADE